MRLGQTVNTHPVAVVYKPLNTELQAPELVVQVWAQVLPSISAVYSRHSSAFESFEWADF